VIKELLADEEPQGKEKPVPAEGERSNGKKFGAAVPNDIAYHDVDIQ
jgi:hypothetical protein